MHAWPKLLVSLALAASLLALTGCEDDPNDLDYLEDAGTGTGTGTD